jgi:hypothetical protein
MSSFRHICSAISQQAAALGVGDGLTCFDGHVDRIAAIPAEQTDVWEHLRMSSPEDPEERIRQLEAQSANYGAVELGTSGTGQSGAAPTSPLPPPVYPPPGDPYQMAGNPYQPPFGTQYMPVPKRGGMSVGMVIGLVATVILVVFGGVGAIIWNFMSKNTPHVTIGSPGNGSFDIPGNGPTINIPTFPSMPSMPSDEPKAGVPGEQLSVAGVQKNETIACNEANVNVSGVNNTVNLTGHCASVTVSGVNNRVMIESTDKIGASGFDNQVTYQSGEPQIDATDSNTVQRG